MELGESQLLLMRMIVGHGIDIEELASIERAVTRHEGFAKRVLTAKEMERFTSLKGRRQIEYLAGRWSAKEANHLIVNSPTVGRYLSSCDFLVTVCADQGYFCS